MMFLINQYSDVAKSLSRWCMKMSFNLYPFGILTNKIDCYKSTRNKVVNYRSASNSFINYSSSKPNRLEFCILCLYFHDIQSQSGREFYQSYFHIDTVCVFPSKTMSKLSIQSSREMWQTRVFNSWLFARPHRTRKLFLEGWIIHFHSTHDN